MSKNFRLVLSLLFITMFLSAIGIKDEKKPPQEANIPEIAEVKVSGRVRLVGNEPFTELVITGQNMEWYIAKDEEPKLKNLQHQNVTVEGTETVTELHFASGIPAGIRRTLTNIRIISVN